MTSTAHHSSPESSNAAAGCSGSLPPLPIRTISESEVPALLESLLTAFGQVEPEEEAALWHELTEAERSIAAFDEERMVGTASAFSFGLSVPGGEIVPAAGVTLVSVAATHRRRGILRSLMRRQLDDVRERGESLAVLTASEGVIYGRFGYGLATKGLRLSIPRRRVGLQEVPGIDGYRLRAVDPTESLAACERVYAELLPGRAGLLERRPGWEKLAVLDPESERNGSRGLQTVVAERLSDGAVVGYARWTMKSNWEVTGAEGKVTVRDVEALEPAAYAALWRFLLSTDLVRDVETRSRPEDDALLGLLTDIRPAEKTLHDVLYLRTVDVGAALAARRYAAELDVVFEVEDEFCPWNTGRWRLSGGPKGAVCERTRDAAELELTARELGAAYLGGVTLRALGDAGRVAERVPGAMAVASAAFRAERAPWLPHGF